jgi:hypothetical protein
MRAAARSRAAAASPGPGPAAVVMAGTAKRACPHRVPRQAESVVNLEFSETVAPMVRDRFHRGVEVGATVAHTPDALLELIQRGLLGEDPRTASANQRACTR